MDSADGRYGWAADDPRWTDAQRAGRGRLEPPPPPTPSFSDRDAATEPLPAWPPAAPPEPAQPPPVPFTLHTQFSPASGGVRTGYGLGAAGPVRPASGPAQTPAPLPAPIPAATPARTPAPAPGSRLDRRVQQRARRRADDEFRAAGRAELFSDDARYSLLVGLTALWYAPVAVLFLVWILIIGAGDGPTVPRLFGGLLWLSAAATISVGVVALLRWARVGWRALTLTIAAALIGGGVTTIAHTLSG